MVNSQVIAETVNAQKIDLNTEVVPNAVPVIEVGVKSVKNGLVASISSSNLNGNTTILSTGGSDVYICSVWISHIKDVTCDSTGAAVLASIGGVNKNLIHTGGITLTVMDKGLSVSFPHPIKVDKNTNIVANSNRTAGTSNTQAGISYFIDEVL